MTWQAPGQGRELQPSGIGQRQTVRKIAPITRSAKDPPMPARPFAVAALIVIAALPAAAQGSRTRTSSRTRDTRSDPSRESSASDHDYRFTPDLRSGQLLDVSSIDGTVTVTQGRGTSAEIVAHKRVRRGNGDLVTVVLEPSRNGFRVCTVYLSRGGDERSCDSHRGNNDRDDSHDAVDVDVAYDIRIPAGVALHVNTIDGNVEVSGIDTPGTIRSVDGDVTFEGVAPLGLNTVDGKVHAIITNRRWDHDVSIRTVDGEVELTLPGDVDADVSGHTVDGAIHSDFPMTVTGKWGPQSFHGSIGRGGSNRLDITTVDGGIRLIASRRRD
jgi:hypothetical protein